MSQIWEVEDDEPFEFSEFDLAANRDRKTQEEIMRGTVMSVIYFFGACMSGLAIVSHFV